MTDLPAECSFCGDHRDRDDLTPVYFGDPPEPSAREYRGVAEMPDRAGRTERFLRGLRLALDDFNRQDGPLSVDLSMGVPVQAIGRSAPIDTAAMEKETPGSIALSLNDHVDEYDAVKVVIEYDPPTPDTEPDVRLCPICAEVMGDG